MNGKHPYTHILKNLFHEQATEIIPLLMPGFRVEEVLDVEMPELRLTEIEQLPSELDQGLVELALPGAIVKSVIHSEWIEHSGKFERAYRVHSPETNKPSFLVIEFQTERDDEKLPRRFLTHFARVDIHVTRHFEIEDDEDEGGDEQEGTLMNKGYYVYPEVLCPFPSAVPAHIRDEFQGQVMMIFNFKKITLWEKDAREFLNSHVSAVYFLLPAMKNADAALLGLAIEELVERFQGNDTELGRHLTGMSLMLQLSEMMSDEEKLAAQEYLKPYAHLITDNPSEE
ncbi:MAG TPA: hypothetical protein VFQ30_10190 [Ktedonobacteraceae bacterium]|nr:hypothetical protein [Ktedonobacteraceae bacterium]